MWWKRFCLLIVMVLLMSACKSAQTRTLSYETEFNSTPPGAEVRTDDGKNRVLGHTPLFIDGELEVERRSSFLSRGIFGLGIVVGAPPVLVGLPIAADGLDERGLTSASGRVMLGGMVMGIGVGTMWLFYRLSAVGDNLVITTSTPGIQDEIKVGKRVMRPSHDDFLAALPPMRYRVIAPNNEVMVVRSDPDKTVNVDFSKSSTDSAEHDDN